MARAREAPLTGEVGETIDFSPADPTFLARVQAALAQGGEVHPAYQGNLVVLRQFDPPVIVKCAAGWGPVRWLRATMIRREYHIYQRLAGIAGIPRCFGLIPGPGLVLEYIPGVPRRGAEILDREAFFAELLRIIRAIHARGVAHGDLAKRTNILVVDRRHPLVVDFGMALVAKKGVAPLHRSIYKLLLRLDLNQWVKIKYDRRLDLASPEDLALYRLTLPERLARAIKKLYTDKEGKRPLSRERRQRQRQP